ncbi:hypothetical protein BC832DRAFT_540324 [Gaertneriomyces semiglobifer]|nr:hypothetical protein BC832DRAFT_540324 [Gaertneriomyces semiglobifer]
MDDRKVVRWTVEQQNDFRCPECQFQAEQVRNSKDRLREVIRHAHEEHPDIRFVRARQPKVTDESQVNNGLAEESSTVTDNAVEEQSHVADETVKESTEATVPVSTEPTPEPIETTDTTSDVAVPVSAEVAPEPIETTDTTSDVAVPVSAEVAPEPIETTDTTSDIAVPVSAEVAPEPIETTDTTSEAIVAVAAEASLEATGETIAKESPKKSKTKKLQELQKFQKSKKSRKRHRETTEDDNVPSKKVKLEHNHDPKLKKLAEEFMTGEPEINEPPQMLHILHRGKVVIRKDKTTWKFSDHVWRPSSQENLEWLATNSLTTSLKEMGFMLKKKVSTFLLKNNAKVVRLWKGMLGDDEPIEDKFDRQWNLLCFKNGVLDLDDVTMSVSRGGRPEDYITVQIPYDYLPLDEEAPMFKELSKILCDMYPDELEREYWLTSFAVALARHNVQLFKVYIGDGSDGKSVMLGLLDEALGPHLSSVSGSCLTKRFNGSRPQPELSVAQQPHIRIIGIDGGDNADHISGETIKCLTGGTKKHSRGLYQNGKQDIYRATPFAFWNSMFYIPDHEKSQIRRYIIGKARTRFVKSGFYDKVANEGIKTTMCVKLGDNTLMSRIKEFAPYMMMILVKYYRRYLIAERESAIAAREPAEPSSDHTLTAESCEALPQNSPMVANEVLEVPPSIIDSTREFLLQCDPLHHFLKESGFVETEHQLPPSEFEEDADIIEEPEETEEEDTSSDEDEGDDMSIDDDDDDESDEDGNDSSDDESVVEQELYRTHQVDIHKLVMFWMKKQDKFKNYAYKKEHLKRLQTLREGIIFKTKTNVKGKNTSPGFWGVRITNAGKKCLEFINKKEFC